MKIKQAQEIRVGDQLLETDGFLLDVITVKQISPKTVELSIASDFSSNSSHWATNGGQKQRYSITTLLYVHEKGDSQ